MNKEQRHNDEDKRFNNNTVFNAVTEFLKSKGYEGPNYIQGNPLSLLSGELIHTQFTLKGEYDSKIIETVKKDLQYAALGFQAVDHQGYISIRHEGVGSLINFQAVLLRVLDQVIGKPIFDFSGFKISHKDGNVNVVATLSIITLSIKETRELADALHHTANLAEGKNP